MNTRSQSAKKIERLRNYSSIFSRSVFTNISKRGDFQLLNTLINLYDSKRSFPTYLDYIKHTYKSIAKAYRCEYVYKNEFINKLLIRQLGTKDTIAINEFRVNNSIVDLALFNGESRAYEIKTEYDNKKRLRQQLEDYSKFFQKCYVVIPEESYRDYVGVFSSKVGIIVMRYNNGRIKLITQKEATDNDELDVRILMRSLRTEEYKNIVLAYHKRLPDVSCFEMFDSCEELMSMIPQQSLRELVLTEIKKRKNNTALLEAFPYEIRQMCLAMNISKAQSENLIQKLNYKMT